MDLLMAAVQNAILRATDGSVDLSEQHIRSIVVELLGDERVQFDCS